jgi:hypothetical protein
MVGASYRLMREAGRRANIHAHIRVHHLQQSTAHYPSQFPTLSRRCRSLPIKLLSGFVDPMPPVVCAVSCRTPMG